MVFREDPIFVPNVGTATMGCFLGASYCRAKALTSSDVTVRVFVLCLRVRPSVDLHLYLRDIGRVIDTYRSFPADGTRVLTGLEGKLGLAGGRS